VEKMSKQNRAKQFLPFNSLRGYYDLIKEKEKIVTPKRELSDYDIELLNNKIMSLEKNMMINVTYYDTDSYKTICGMLSKIDIEHKYLVIVKSRISFSDITNIDNFR